ncbi:MAG: hypothetical protein KA792_10790, partial [Bacteroidales bacterium]|nr:hypothetical protein [Bacteroidales bacterium]
MLNLFKSKSLGLMLLFLVLPVFIFASGGSSTGISIGNIRLEFILFGLVLLGVALFHHKTFYVALTGFIVILIYKLVF